ncbi:MAG: phosphonate C-P lyase system protein PhnH [Cyclobacteriaceae bacterium]
MRREVSYDEVFDAQEQFRIIMDAMARPGKIHRLPQLDILPPEGLNKVSALVGFGLLNADVSFACSDFNENEIESYLSVNTGAYPSSIELADYVFFTGNEDASVLQKVKMGTLSYPEQSATLILSITSISEMETEGVLKIILKGPGIENTNTVFVTGVNDKLLNEIKIINQEFPLGVDLILTDIDNQLICIPRSNHFIVGYK